MNQCREIQLLTLLKFETISRNLWAFFVLGDRRDEVIKYKQEVRNRL